MAVAGGVLLVFFALSQLHQVTFGLFTHPPVYGLWVPRISTLALFSVPAAIVLALLAWLDTSARRLPTWAALALLIVVGVATAAAIGVVRGRTGDLTRGLTAGPKAVYYTSDLHYVYEHGLRRFVEDRPQLAHAFRTYSGKTHPSGIFVLLYLLFRAFGSSHTLRIATVIAILSMAAAISAWSIGRTLAGERAGRIAAALTVAAPGLLILAYGSEDGIYGTLISAAAALFMTAIYRRSSGWGIAAGAVLGFGTFFTYATVFVALAAVIAVALQRVGVRAAAKILGGAAVGGVAVIVLLRLGIGWNLFAEYATVPPAERSYDAYWIVGSPAAWLIFAGLPLAGIGVLGLWVRVPGARRPVLPAVLAAIMVIWAALPPGLTHLRPGEVERTWAFLYPVIAACAAAVIDRWTADKGRWRGPIVGGLVLISVAQAVLLQALWDTLF
jgi:Dolichyl-phosphate-mannose-protein mannosyltransferase